MSSQVVDQVVNELRGAWRFRWIAMIVAWVVCVGGWIVVFSLPDMYESSAKVYVDTRTMLKPLLDKLTVEADIYSQLRLVRQGMLGRPQLERVARETGLDRDAHTPEEMAALVDALRSRIRIEGGGSADREAGGGLYIIAYQDASRDKSIEVVSHLLDTFVEDTLGGKREGSEEAQRFLMKQIAEYEAKLSESENRLAEFKKKNVGLVPGEQTGDYFTRLRAEIDGATKAESDLAVALSRRDALQRQLRGEAPNLSAPAPASTPAGGGANDTSARIAENQARLDELLLRFTDRHPDVIATRETLDQLKQRREEEIAALRRGDASAVASSGIAGNPVYQSIQLALNQAEVEIAALRRQIAGHQEKARELRGLVNTAPQVEAEYARLNRDYEVTREGYRELVNRLQKARLSERADETGVVKFEVVDPPAAAFHPVAPNRNRLLFVILAVGLGLGGGVAYLLHQLRPVFNNARSLADITGLPVIGAISMTWLDRKRLESRLRRLAFGGAAAGLMLVFAGAVLFQSAGARTMQKILGAS
jgi:polysaccharide chain length determinant protein (PEP-CTERM system associated)